MGTNYKIIILTEMVLMYGGGLMVAKQKNSTQTWAWIIVNTVPKTLLPTAVLLLILLTLADIGAGGFAALLGAVIAMSLIMVTYKQSLPAVSDYLKKYLAQGGK